MTIRNKWSSFNSGGGGNPDFPPYPYDNNGWNWWSELMEVKAAHALGYKGEGIKLGSSDGGLPPSFRFKFACMQSLSYNLDGFISDLPPGGLLAGVLVGTPATHQTLRFTAQSGSPVDVTFDGSERVGSVATTSDIRDTLGNMATTINAAFSSAGEPGAAFVLEDPNASGPPPFFWLCIHSTVEGATSSLTMDGGASDKDLCDALGFGDRTSLNAPFAPFEPLAATSSRTGRTPLAGGWWIFFGGTSMIRFKYMTIGVHEALSGLDVDIQWPKKKESLEVQQRFTNAVEPTVYLASTAPASKAFRDEGATSVPGDRLFTPATGGASSEKMRQQIGVRVGDQAILKDSLDKGTYTVVKVNYANPGVSNEFTSVEFDRDFPSGSQSGINFDWSLQDELLPFYNYSSEDHATLIQVPALAGSSTGVVGIAPKVTFVPFRPMRNRASETAVWDICAKARCQVIHSRFAYLREDLVPLYDLIRDRGSILCMPGVENFNYDTRAFIEGRAISSAQTTVDNYDWANPPDWKASVNPSADRIRGNSGFGSPISVSAPAGGSAQFSGITRTIPLGSACISAGYGYEHADLLGLAKTSAYGISWQMFSSGASSMANMLVAATLCLIRQALNDKRANNKAFTEAKYILESAVDIPGNANTALYGTGRVNVRKAVEMAESLKKNFLG